jgi:hypothetical protein
MECRVYVSAFNHADTNVIVRAVDQAPWRDNEMVQLFIKEKSKTCLEFATVVLHKTRLIGRVHSSGTANRQ